VDLLQVCHDSEQRKSRSKQVLVSLQLVISHRRVGSFMPEIRPSALCRWLSLAYVLRTATPRTGKQENNTRSLLKTPALTIKEGEDLDTLSRNDKRYPLADQNAHHSVSRESNV
jgi:hypothetical protein